MSLSVQKANYAVDMYQKQDLKSWMKKGKNILCFAVCDNTIPAFARIRQNHSKINQNMRISGFLVIIQIHFLKGEIKSHGTDVIIR